MEDPKPNIDGNAPTPPGTPSAPPPAAEIVVNGPVTEHTANLAQELESEKKLRKDRELRIAQLEDENFQLKKIPTAEKTKAKRVPITFFDEDE